MSQDLTGHGGHGNASPAESQARRRLKTCRRPDRSGMHLVREKTVRRLPRTEIRVLVAPRQYRIVDLAVYAHQEPEDELPWELPLAVIEIVSPDDRHEEIVKRLEEFRAWSVPHVWLVDPGMRWMYIYRDAGLTGGVRAAGIRRADFRRRDPGCRAPDRLRTPDPALPPRTEYLLQFSNLGSTAPTGRRRRARLPRPRWPCRSGCRFSGR